MRAHVVFGVALSCALLWADQASAQRVLLVRPPEADATLSEAFNRLRAELALNAFEVTVLETPDQGISAEALEIEAQKADALAGIALTREAGSATAEVCIADRVTGKRSQRRLAVAGTVEAPRLLAVRAADLLRASLRELPVGERPPPDVVGVAAEPPPQAVRAWSMSRRRWELRAAGGLLGAGRFGVAGGASLALFFHPVQRLGIGLTVLGPLFGARYDAPTGGASIRQELALARASWNFLPDGVWRLGPILGVGAYHLQAQGEVQAPLRGLSAGMFSFTATGGLEVELGVTQVVSLAASVEALLFTPEPVVAVDTSQANARQPLVLSSLGLGVAF
jgi:hypothetical protein